MGVWQADASCRKGVDSFAISVFVGDVASCDDFGEVGHLSSRVIWILYLYRPKSEDWGGLAK